MRGGFEHQPLERNSHEYLPEPGKMNNPNVQAAENGAQDAMEFQLWVAKQSAQLSRLKVFASMAKSINDQQ
jgi:hypothetical protein